jgi:hypothetical protein
MPFPGANQRVIFHGKWTAVSIFLAEYSGIKKASQTFRPSWKKIQRQDAKDPLRQIFEFISACLYNSR